MADMTDWDDDILSEDEMDENIIELTDIADEDDHATKEDVVELEDKVIELTDIVEEENTDFDLDIVREESAEVEEDFDLEDDQEMVLSQNLSLSPELLETALEKVIERKFSDKIETILFEVMERVIEKEIAEIKESLQKDLNQIGNA